MTDSQPKPALGRPRSTPSEIEATKQAILAAAATVYARSGDEPPVQEVLDAAKVSRATFYKYFPAKDALQKALLDATVTLMLNAIQGAIDAETTPVARVDAAIRTYLQWVARSPALYRTLLTTALRPGSPTAEIRQKGIARFAKQLASEVERAGLPAADPLVYQALVLAAEGTAMRLVQTQQPPEAAFVERARKSLVRIIAATLSQGGDDIPPLPRPQS